MGTEKSLEPLDLIDLLSERHAQIRKLTEKTWNDNNDIYISHSEWYIMARIYNHRPTISSVTRNVEITRQATHKFIKKLETKGLAETLPVENNRKEKSIQLTDFGVECYDKYEVMKTELERRIAETIGEYQVSELKQLLKMEWDL
ncbi:MarR family winged helix-turn-helix transcriptional regulator [Salimicrobium flavidum]|uniref:DNA-binding transcriptional regulator, MarR family n=1 Tax=Salimicrobium flavidum TaxID=570947 RepID=A0A1N7J9T5_9BACI|nr:winged helix DNA-binding protein [Salimicrobium flavidum]SIS46113.1 DNA-binding transcriptional regulator, MarR family [Salimicrobium flavidum]